MEKAPACSCGGEASGRKRIILACSGASNVGELSNAAAVALTREGFGSKACTASLAIRTPSVMRKAEDADEIIIIDGCPVGCAGKIAEAAGVTPDQHLVITDLGIEKKGDMDINEYDLETVVSAAWEGKGIAKKATEEKKSNNDSGCGGGCCSAGRAAGTLVVEWRHIGESVDRTCVRCAATGTTLADVVNEIRPMLAERGIQVKVVETVLPPERIAESNTILFNGTPIEDLLDEARVEMTPCVSCTCITGTDAECRAIICGDETHEEVPADLIRKAAGRAVGL